MNSHQTTQKNVFVIISKQQENQQVFYEIEVDDAKTAQPVITVDETFDSLEEVNDFLDRDIKPTYHISKQMIIDFTKLKNN